MRTAVIGASHWDGRCDWEKTLKDDDYFRHEWDAAFLAGHIEEIKDAMNPAEIREKYYEWQFGFRTNVDMAYVFLDWSKSSWSLESIKAELRKGHERHQKVPQPPD